MLSNAILAILLTLFAGLSTGIGGAIAFFTKHTNKKLLSISLGFSAGVMLYVAFVELFFQSQTFITSQLGDKLGNWITVLSFFAGIAIIGMIDVLIPSCENPHEAHKVEDMRNKNMLKRCKHKMSKKCRHLYRLGIFTAIALTIHNFPEGIATFVSTLADVKLGIAIAIAVAIHNIPEGIAISVPIYYSTKNRKKAFLYSSLTGLSEPLGALIAYFILRNYFNELIAGIIFAGVAGIMVYISLDELLPSAREYGKPHWAILGVISGMGVMAVSLLLLI